MEKIFWKNGVQYKVEAIVAAETIRNLQNKLGKDTITAKDLLDASRDENAPLHSCFEWDDGIAAEKYREWQARHIINSIVIQNVSDDTSLPPTRLFVNVVKSGSPKVKGQYASITVAFANETYHKQVLANALIELQNFRRKYQVYSELSGVFSAIDSFSDSLNSKD